LPAKVERSFGIVAGRVVPFSCKTGGFFVARARGISSSEELMISLNTMKNMNF